MEVIPWLWLLHSLHSGQTVVYIVYTTGGAFDLYSSHSTSYSYSTGPGIYGSKRTESEGEARGQGLFTAINPWQPVL